MAELTMYASYVVVFLVAGLVGFGELVARYRDAPLDVARRLPAFVYMVLNAIAGVIALRAIDSFGWTFGAPENAVRMIQVAAAGLSAMAVLRSSLFTVRVGEVDVNAGPSGLLRVILDALDRNLDRGRAQRRSDAVQEIMSAVDFEKAKQALPAYCLTLMQNVPAEEQNAMKDQVSKLDVGGHGGGTMPRARLLGLILIDVVGEDVLRASVEALGDEIR